VREVWLKKGLISSSSKTAAGLSDHTVYQAVGISAGLFRARRTTPSMSDQLASWLRDIATELSPIALILFCVRHILQDLLGSIALPCGRLVTCRGRPFRAAAAVGNACRKRRGSASGGSVCLGYSQPLAFPSTLPFGRSSCFKTAPGRSGCL
jgi:hypothetical protein